MSELLLQPARAQAPITVPDYQRYVLPDGTVWTLFYRTDHGYLLRFPNWRILH